MSEVASGSGSRLQSHFRDLEQQYETSTFGMWVFLVTELMFFGGLFMAYTFYRIQFPDSWIHASEHLNRWLGLGNTIVLIASSLTMALAVHSARMSKGKMVAFWIGMTMLLGSIFLGVKAYEYMGKWEHGLFPGNFFFVSPHGVADTGHQKIYFSLYFAMTGLHATHMVIGMGIMVYIALQALKGAYTEKWFTPVEILGLYWHFVDLVWIFLFPLLYLLGHSA